MASYKNIQKSRKKKDSHFSYSSERMTRLTSSEAAPRQDKQPAVLSVKHNQDPVERGEGEESTQSTVSSELQINTEALSKLQVTQHKSSVKLTNLFYRK